MPNWPTGGVVTLNTLLARDQAFAAELKSTASGPQRRLHVQRGQYAFPEQCPGNLLLYNKQRYSTTPACHRRPVAGNGHGASPNSMPPRRYQAGPVGTDRQWGFVNAWVSFYAAGLFAMNNGV